MTTEPVKVRYSFHKSRNGVGAPVRLQNGPAPNPVPKGRIPRISRLVALAHKFERILDSRQVASMAELAAVGHVTRARITQIMDLLLLAPDIQEALLFLPGAESGRDPVTLRELRYVCQTPVWAEQRVRWAELAVPGAQPAATLAAPVNDESDG